MLTMCGAGGCCGKIHVRFTLKTIMLKIITGSSMVAQFYVNLLLQWFGRGRQEAPLSFSNPMTEPGSTMMVPISQIDVRALELDPIVFEPLPTVHDLTPLSTKVQHERGQLHNRNAAIPIVPFSADDSAIYAHDWFGNAPDTH